MPLFCGEDLNFGAFSKYFPPESVAQLQQKCENKSLRNRNLKTILQQWHLLSFYSIE
jgi:hypothetical protein